MRYARSSSILLLAALATFGLGCDSSLVTAIAPGTNVFDMTHSELVREYYTGVPDRQRLVLKTEGAWNATWSQIYAGLQPKPPVPDVSFAAEMVIVVSMGTRPSGGYSIEIDEVHESDGKLYVSVVETSPGASCGLTAALTAPVFAIRVPRRDGAVVFSERTETHECQ
jgi:hypothetical protein